ncbi:MULTISPECIES: hypothetical protein [Vibrio]|nr:hypothetical protein [Vibrio nereis]
MDKVLVYADCEEGLIRLVTRSIYEDFQAEIGYDVLSNKLPVWEEADYGAMLAALMSQSSEESGKSVFYDIACKWESFRRIN